MIVNGYVYSKSWLNKSLRFLKGFYKEVLKIILILRKDTRKKKKIKQSKIVKFL